MQASTSGLGFLVGYFVLYSIRSGSKTQDAFKSLLGLSAGGLAGSFLLSPNGSLIPGLDAAILCGAETYAVIAIVLSAIFSFTGKSLPNDMNCFAVVLARILSSSWSKWTWTPYCRRRWN